MPAQQPCSYSRPTHSPRLPTAACGCCASDLGLWEEGALQQLRGLMDMQIGVGLLNWPRSLLVAVPVVTETRVCFKNLFQPPSPLCSLPFSSIHLHCHPHPQRRQCNSLHPLHAYHHAQAHSALPAQGHSMLGPQGRVRFPPREHVRGYRRSGALDPAPLTQQAGKLPRCNQGRRRWH